MPLAGLFFLDLRRFPFPNFTSRQYNLRFRIFEKKTSTGYPNRLLNDRIPRFYEEVRICTSHPNRRKQNRKAARLMLMPAQKASFGSTPQSDRSRSPEEIESG